MNAATRSPQSRAARRRTQVLACCLAIVGILAAPADASKPRAASTAGSASCKGLHATLAFLSADPGAVRTAGAVPATWNLALTSAGRATLLLDSYNCPWTFGGVTRNVTTTELFAMLDSSTLPSPARQHASSDVMGAPLDFYILALSANDPAFVHWLQRTSGLGDVVRYVPGLRSQASGAGLQQVSFSAPAPASSPFTLTQTFSPSFFPVSPFRTNFWRETSHGTVEIEDVSDGDTLGQFVTWTLNTGASTPMGRMIGGASQTAQCGASAPDPLLGVATHQVAPGCLTAEEGGSDWHVQVLPNAAPPAPAGRPAPSRAASRG